MKTKRLDQGLHYDYSRVVYMGRDIQVEIGCPIHGWFLQRAGDHRGGSGCQKCGAESRAKVNMIKYGAANAFQSKLIMDRVAQKNIEMYGCPNPSQRDDIKQKKKKTLLENFGSDDTYRVINAKKQQTCLDRYGVTSHSKVKEIAAKSVATRMKRGWQVTNSSKEATQYFDSYVIMKGYDDKQVAYANAEKGLHEWGNQIDGVWALFDFVAFEKGYRGDINHIIEIIEYHGPFHYTDNDVEIRGEAPAYPWKTKKSISIRDSRNKDKIKEKFVLDHNISFTVILPEKYHKSNSIL